MAPLRKILWLLAPLWLCPYLASAKAAQASAPLPIEFLLPAVPYSLATDRAWTALVESFNLKNPKTPVHLIRRGEEFSALRELMARQLAGNLPDLAALDPAELSAVLPLQVLKPMPGTLVKALGGQPYSLPFLRAMPLLIANQHKLSGQALPKDWKGLESLLQAFIQRDVVSEDSESSSGFQLALPLQGARGLWIFEALTRIPLWKRETGGLRSSRTLIEPIHRIQRLLDAPHVARAGESWEQAVQSFIEGKTPLLIGTSDMLPYLASRAQFPLAVGPLPSAGTAVSEGKPTSLLAGSDLVMTRDRPQTRSFLEFIYSETASAQWARPGGWLPVNPTWPRSKAWRDHPPASFEGLAALLKTQSAGPRTQDPDLVRARSEWIQSLHALFGKKDERSELESLLTQIDGRLASHSY